MSTVLNKNFHLLFLQGEYECKEWYISTDSMNYCIQVPHAVPFNDFPTVIVGSGHASMGSSLQVVDVF